MQLVMNASLGFNRNTLVSDSSGVRYGSYLSKGTDSPAEPQSECVGYLIFSSTTKRDHV